MRSRVTEIVNSFDHTVQFFWSCKWANVDFKLVQIWILITLYKHYISHYILLETVLKPRTKKCKSSIFSHNMGKNIYILYITTHHKERTLNQYHPMSYGVFNLDFLSNLRQPAYFKSSLFFKDGCLNYIYEKRMFTNIVD